MRARMRWASAPPERLNFLFGNSLATYSVRFSDRGIEWQPLGNPFMPVKKSRFCPRQRQ